jgi:heme oxygenase (mycobilin-producing)
MIRIVKMSFKTENIEDFKAQFYKSKSTIESFEGCSSVTLLNDIHHSNIFFTYSMWKDENHLNLYRNSAFFGETWSTVKVWFDGKPEAWSVEEK